MFRRLFTTIISFALAFGGILMLVSCEEKNDKITLSIITTPMSENDYTSKIPYTIERCDTCFFKPATQLSPTLAKTAIVLSSSAYNQSVTKENLKNLGFSKINSYNYDQNYDENGVGITFGTKFINDTPIIAIVLRGTLAKEWHSNFDIGTDVKNTLHHAGFNNASEYVLKKLAEYEEEIEVNGKDAKYFVTGHSRGGAAANLCAKKLIDQKGASKVYAYTFASPNTTLDKNVHNTEYSGIFNFVNPEDFIAFVPLESWGFQKYGTTKYLFSSTNDDAYDKSISSANEKYKLYKNRELKTYGGTEKLSRFLEDAHTLAPTVDAYYNKKYEILDDEMSMYEFMDMVAELLNNENLLTNGLIILNCDDTAFESIRNFMMLGMNSETALLPNYSDSLISYTHSAESYLCFLEVYLSDM